MRPTKAETGGGDDNIAGGVDQRRLGIAYVVVTGGVIAVMLLALWCMLSSDSPHEFCVFVWLSSLFLLVLSQVAFIAIGRRLRGPAEISVVVLALLLLAGFIMFIAVASIAPTG
jgi:hypothetical protein